MSKARDNANPNGVLLATRVMTGTATGEYISNVFSSQYRNYKMIFSGGATGDAAINARFGTGGTADTGTPYVWAGFWSYFSYSATGTTYSGSSTNNFYLVPVTGSVATSTIRSASSTDIYNPYELAQTSYTTLSNHWSGYAYYINGIRQSAQQYTDLYLYATAGNIWGTVSIYGYRA